MPFAGDAPQGLVFKVERLEERGTQLEQLPGRIDDLTLQVRQMRTEMRGEFSAVRTEMSDQGATVVATLRSEMAAQGAALR